MSAILIRGLDPKTVRRLKARAKRNGRSLQNEAKLALEQASGLSFAAMRQISKEWHQRLKGRKFANSASSIRADRRR